MVRKWMVSVVIGALLLDLVLVIRYTVTLPGDTARTEAISFVADTFVTSTPPATPGTPKDVDDPSPPAERPAPSPVVDDPSPRSPGN